MEMIYFILGVLTVLFIFGVIGMVKIWKRISEIQFSEESMEDFIEDTADDLNTELEKLYDHFDKEVDRIEKASAYESQELGKLIDSRADKISHSIEQRLQKIE